MGLTYGAAFARLSVIYDFIPLTTLDCSLFWIVFRRVRVKDIFVGKEY